MPEFFEYPVEIPPLDGTEIVLLLSGGHVKRCTTQDIMDLGAPSGPQGPTGPPGGGWFARYTFSTSTADADPGAGRLRFSNGTQNASTVVRADLFSNDGLDLTSLLDMLDDSTSVVKGLLRIYKEDDSTKYIVFAVGSMAAPSGYRNLVVVPVAYSDANPFANNDHVVATFTFTGDKGDQGIQGNQGIQGVQGIQGFSGTSGSGALPYNFDTTTTDSDPGSGKLRLNNATPASATFLYADDLCATAVAVNTYLASLGGSTNDLKAYIEVSNSDKTKLHVWSMATALTHVTSYTKFPLTYIQGAGSFTNGEPVFLSMLRVGDKGREPIPLTTAQYAALSPPDPNTWYVITDNP